MTVESFPENIYCFIVLFPDMRFRHSRWVTLTLRRVRNSTYARASIDILLPPDLVGKRAYIDATIYIDENPPAQGTATQEESRDLCSELNELEEAIEELFSPGSVIDVALSMYEEKRRQELALRTIYRKRDRRGKTAATEEVELDKVEIAEMQNVKSKIQELKKKLADLSRRLRCR